ncbi:MEI5 protein [Purpureocillium lavendulum]|uniref:MEI5 protein n=1 Tax=Purpureocillium lavendulum TaxID=1247861 RepID=A0AB34FCN6_9HYPO|nr:MEI5 protein [Purpureocillium lavendulum]
MTGILFDKGLTRQDLLVLQNLAADVRDYRRRRRNKEQKQPARKRDAATLATLKAFNDPAGAQFEPTILTTRSVLRVETDVVMIMHLLLYFCTSVPSAALLYWNFSCVHGLLHLAMQATYMGTYTLMMHQHIHLGGILSKRYAVLDAVFPYITDPLMGHSWNSYYYHHVKHHHVENNGPDDLSSTMRYQRDNFVHFLCYAGRFYFLIWLDLPLYFLKKNRIGLATKAALWELGWAGLMVGNWGQHAFVDKGRPDSDYRSKSKAEYASQGALVFHGIDFVMITVRLLLKDYRTLAECMVPIGGQISMTMDERVEFLKGRTQQFTEKDIQRKP